MERKLLFFFYCIIAIPLFSQTFKGQVTDKNGQPVPYVAFYIREINSGFTTDNNGHYQTTLAPGRYTFDISSLGYIPQTFNIEMTAAGIEKNIILQERIYELQEVKISLDGEDPAYAVMRKVIASAPYYRTHVSHYHALTYLKGTGKLKGIPGIFKLSKEVREESKKYMDRLFLIEEQRKVTFNAPDKWDNEILAYSNSFPENIQVSFETTNINLYQPTLFGRISPISTGAFSYYNYKLEAFYAEGAYFVNKIKVIPKKDNPKLLSGYLYILENLWCISAADVSLSVSGMNGDFTVTCSEVKPGVFLPTSVSVESDFSMMGIKAEASYLSGITYSEVEVLPAPATVTASAHTVSKLEKPLTKKEQELKTKIEELSAKENLSTREAYKLSRLISKSLEQKDTVRSKYKYERLPRVRNIKTDSLAGKRDSMYWSAIRSVPLRLEEQESYAYKEKLTLARDSVKKDSTHKSSLADDIMETFMIGNTFYTKNKKAWITAGGLTTYVPEYNFVDGFWLGAKISTGISLNKYSTLAFSPEAYYTTARKEWVGKATVALYYAPRRLGKLTLGGGSESADYNGESGESRMINILSSATFGRNHIKFFNNKYLFIRNEIELANSLMFMAGLSWQKRSVLENSIHRSWFKKEARPNIPLNPAYTPMPTNQLLKASFYLEYTPEHYYRMRGKRKIYEKSSYPTFRLSYDRAFDHGGHDIVSPVYNRMELSARQSVDFGLFNTFNWYVNGGLLWGERNMFFPDYKHFASTKFPLTGRTFSEGFSLLDNYEYSTSTRWAQANLAWYTPYLLVKHLPFLKKKNFDEALHLRLLGVYKRDVYSELGYSVGISDLLRAGVFVGFEKLKYRSVGISISLPIQSIII